jgi:YfiH family protein
MHDCLDHKQRMPRRTGCDPRQENLIMLISQPLAALAGIQHGFFTRRGGVSGGIYASLNCGYGSRDERHHVQENRARVAAWLGAEQHRLITPRQAHTAHAVIARASWTPDQAPEADAVITAEPGLAVGVLAADCAPVLLADATAGVVGAVHAGWRGARGGIIQSAVARMVELGARSDAITAAVGPAISASVYEVGEDFRLDFLKQSPGNETLFHVPAGKARPHFDLPAYVMMQLRAAGVSQTTSLGLCTLSSESLFFSYRRSRAQGHDDYGRQISAIVLRHVDNVR